MAKRGKTYTVQVITLRPGEVFQYSPPLAANETITSANVTGSVGVFEIVQVTTTTVTLRGTMAGTSSMRVRTNLRTIDVAVSVTAPTTPPTPPREPRRRRRRRRR